MKGIFQLFIRGGIPVTAPANMEATITANHISGRIAAILLGLSVIVATAAAMITKGLIMAMQALQTYCGLPGMTRDLDEHDPMVLLVPVIALLVISVFLRYAGDKTRQLFKPVQSILSVNAGIPLGLEGAVADLPLGVAGQVRKGRAREKQILAAAAMSGGIAFLFGSPLAAIALIIELLIVELSWIGITTVVLGGGTGMLLHYWLTGSDPVFMMPEVAKAGVPALLGYTATGLLVGLVAALAKKMINGMANLFQKLPFDKLWWPVAGAFITGLLGYFAPEVLGAGYEHIDSLLLGQVTLQFLVVMAAGKLVLMSIAVGSGIPGGTIAPLLVSGGALGLFVTFLLQFMFPAVHLNFALAALVGMTAMFAGGNRVLPAAVFFAIETTHIMNALLPVICGCTAAYLVVFLLAKKKVAQPAVLPEKIS
ncbi:chloride channel protein [Chitinophaga filiformis]|uniref:Chloride channel protein n=1 Tax=Chitinophaga filiformis TaxID=104663 RepID=A0ABY4I277_CHIFI|nr:chloride channel protein [Chitinophaga filiformis]UPK70191.1 chloride channel protein [Chitinophaga filiformis]